MSPGPARPQSAPLLRTVMSRSTIGLFVGLLLGFVAIFGGFLEFLAVVLFATAGLLVGRFLDGKLDLQDFAGSRGRRS